MKQLLRQPNGSSRSERCERMRVMFGQATHLWVNERMWRGRCSRVAWAEYRAPESAKLFSVRNSNRRVWQQKQLRMEMVSVSLRAVDVLSVTWIGNALLTFGNGMDFTPTPPQLLRLSTVTDRGPRQTTPAFVTMETEQNVLSPAKPTQVRVREQFGFWADN